MTITTTDDVTHLRALLAERDASLDEAKRWLEYAATHRGFDFDFDTWAAGVEKVLGRPPKYLYVVNQRAEKAEAACAEQTARAERAEAEADHLNRLVIKVRTDRDAALAEVEWERETLREAHASTCSALGLSVSFGFRAGQDIDAARRVVAERDQALAANVEMRAALDVLVAMVASDATDGLLAAMANAASILSRPDLGAGMVLVPRERLTALRDVLTELAPTCRCDAAWTSRGRHEVNAMCHLVDDAKAAIADLDALLKQGGG